MGSPKVSDFQIAMNGYCFICLVKINEDIIKRESGFDISTKTVQSSLQSLSRFLELDRGKVFLAESLVPPPPDLMSKVERSRLVVELCRYCANMNDGFAKLYKQLEKVTMEVMSQLMKLEGKLMKSTSEEGIKLTDLGEDGKLKIAKVLRDETIKKCSRKLATVSPLPRINIRRMTTKNILKHKLLYKNSCRPEQKEHNSPSTPTPSSTNILIRPTEIIIPEMKLDCSEDEKFEMNDLCMEQSMDFDPLDTSGLIESDAIDKEEEVINQNIAHGGPSSHLPSTAVYCHPPTKLRSKTRVKCKQCV